MQKENEQPQELEVIFKGKEESITLPTGNILLIRELNGEDEEIISSESLSENGDNIYQFLAGIIIKDKDLGRKPTPEDIKKYPINDKYYLLFKQRIINHGYDMQFSSICSTPSCNEQKNDYDQNLKEFDGDLSDPKYIPENHKHIQKYPLGKTREVEFTLNSGKKLKYSILDGNLEYAALELKDQTKNAPLKIRNLMIDNHGSWIKITNFKAFSVKEMGEIRGHVTKSDSQFDPIVNYSCPKCKRNYFKSLFALPTFFYPEVLM